MAATKDGPPPKRSAGRTIFLPSPQTPLSNQSKTRMEEEEDEEEEDGQGEADTQQGLSAESQAAFMASQSMQLAEKDTQESVSRCCSGPCFIPV